MHCYVYVTKSPIYIMQMMCVDNRRPYSTPHHHLAVAVAVVMSTLNIRSACACAPQKQRLWFARCRSTIIIIILSSSARYFWLTLYILPRAPVIHDVHYDRRPNCLIIDHICQTPPSLPHTLGSPARLAVRSLFRAACVPGGTDSHRPHAQGLPPPSHSYINI